MIRRPKHNVLSIWTVYNSPVDAPMMFIARRFEIEKDGGERPTGETVQAKDLEMVRRALALRGLTCLPRDPDDEPHIVECWL